MSLSPDGRLFFAPAYDLVYDTGQPYIFSMVRDKAGNLYVGTGDEGKVFKIDPQGKGSLYFQSKELNVFALALDSSDTLYVGTSPDGKVYKVTGPNQSTEFCNPESKYIWSMVFDNSDNLYVGTGANGMIYKVDKSGKKSTFYTCSDNHVVCLTRGCQQQSSCGDLSRRPDCRNHSGRKRICSDGHSAGGGACARLRIVSAPSMRLLPLQGDRDISLLRSRPPRPAQPRLPSQRLAIAVESIAVSAEKSKDSKTVTAPGGEKESAGRQIGRLCHYERWKHGNHL